MNSSCSGQEAKNKGLVICYYCHKSFSSLGTGSETKGMVVNCPHCGKSLRLGKTMSGRTWIIRQFKILGLFALLGVIGILTWIFGTVEPSPMAWLGLGGSIFFVAVFVFCVVLTLYRIARARKTLLFKKTHNTRKETRKG